MDIKGIKAMGAMADLIPKNQINKLLFKQFIVEKDEIKDEYIYNYYVLPKESGLYRMGYTVEGSSTSNLVYGHEHRLFIGPKIRKDLAERAENLELSIDMGWFWFISQPMVWFLDLINGFVDNWALSIIVFTFILKLVLFPVTAKGFVSMGNMRKVGPKMKELQDRYSDDRQKLSQEMMKLYKTEKVNPLGGCLPPSQELTHRRSVLSRLVSRHPPGLSPDRAR